MFYDRNRWSLLGCLTILMLLSTSCASTQPAQDIITLQNTDRDDIQLTISTKYSVDLDEFEKLAETRYPQLQLIQVGNYTSNYSDEYAQQLANNDLTDIIITWPLDEAARKCDDRLIDLSGMPFTSKYRIAMLNDIADEGRLYYLPGPSQMRGILYNKTMFDENGWSLPTDFDEFVSLCRQIEGTGMRSLQLGFFNKEVLLYAFMGFGYTESFSGPQSVQFIKTYNEGKGSFADFAEPAFTSFERLIEEGIFRPEDLSIRYPIREQMFYNRQCAMISDGISLAQTARKKGYSDEYALMPFFSPGTNGSWGHVILTQYIGLNQELTRPEHKAKYHMAIELMEFISTPEGQLALAGGNTSMVSSLVNSPVPDAAELAPMHDSIAAGRYAVYPSFPNASTALYDALSSMIKGEITREEAIRQIDEANESPAPKEKSPKIGTASEPFTLTDTGNYVTDVLREYAGTDISLFLDNGKDGKFNARGISAKFYQGDILKSDVTDRVLPVLQHGEKGYLNIITMTGAQLKQALEYSLEGGSYFYYFSGLKMTYDPFLEPGNRIKSITDSSGKPIEDDKTYTSAILEGSVEEAYITSCQTTQILIQDLILKSVEEKGTITPVRDGRFQIPESEV